MEGTCIMKKIIAAIMCGLLFFTAYGIKSYGLRKLNTAVDTSKKIEAVNSNKFSTTEDLKNKRIGVLVGSVQDTYVTKNYPNAKLMQFKSPPDLLVALKAKQVDAILYTYEITKEMIRNDDSMDFLGENVFDVTIATGFNKKNTELKGEFDSFLKKIKSDGVYDDMVKRWIDGKSYKMPEIKNNETNGELIVGIVSDKGMPFTIVENGKMVGFDVELTERFAAELNKKLVFSDMEFGNLIAAVSTNKIDMITSTLMITEERKEKINFSDPYYKMGTRFLVLKSNLAKYAMDNHNKEFKTSFIKGISDSFYNNIISENRYMLIVEGLKTTIIITIFAAIFGTILGMLICPMRMSKQRIINSIAKIYIAVLRGTPVLVILMLIFYVVFASVNINAMIVSIIGFSLNFAAYVSEMFRAAILSIDKGQKEAGIAGGFTKTQTFLYIIMPQAVKQVLPVYKGEIISLLKMTSIVGYIAVQDLTKASEIIRSRTFDAFFPLIMVAILYFVISWILTAFLDFIGRKLDPRAKMQLKSNELSNNRTV